MASIIVSAKSGSDWTENELTAFNINIVGQDSAEFFGVSPLPEPSVPPAILTTTTATVALAANDGATWEFLFFMGRAMSGPEANVDAFALELLRLMRYRTFGRVVTCNVNLTFTMCGKECHAQTDVCAFDSDSFLLVLQEDKRNLSPQPLPVAQLVAEAIAAFEYNNKLRQNPVLDWMMLGIIMRGTLPIFYKIHVTQDLVTCVKLGQYPAIVTNIFEHVPEFPDDENLGMLSLANRRIALECYEAFKAFVIPPLP
jgi:hypothetical protein